MAVYRPGAFALMRGGRKDICSALSRGRGIWGERGEGIPSRGAAGFVWKDSARRGRLQGAVVGVFERGRAEGGVARGVEVKVSRRAGFAAKVFRHTDGTTGRSPGTGRDGEGLDGRMDGAGAWMRCKGGHRRRLRRMAALWGDVPCPMGEGRETIPNFV